MDLLEAVKQKAGQFQTLLNNRLYLFKVNGTYIELQQPQLSRRDGSCTLYIPENQGDLSLADNLGFIRGSLVYEVKDEVLSLERYSFGFEHNNTYVQLHEDKAHNKLRYGFHYDMDKKQAQPITHPLHHLQFGVLDVPRFEMQPQGDELVVFGSFLDLIKETFYNNTAQPKQRPKLECANLYLSGYR